MALNVQKACCQDESSLTLKTLLCWTGIWAYLLTGLSVLLCWLTWVLKNWRNFSQLSVDDLASW